MLKYIVKRVAIAAITILVILFILFLLLSLMPGSPFNDETLTQSQIDLLRKSYGLDQPFYVQFIKYVGNVLQGDFGISYNIQSNVSISQLVSAKIKVSLLIGLQAVVLGSFVGLILGIVAAIKRGNIIDSTATVISVIGVSLPSFVFALLLQYFFAYKLKLFSIYYDSDLSFLSSILPTIALSMFTLANIARYSRSELIEVLNSDYILLAETKGLSRGRVITVHALRNALIGVITVLAPLVVGLLSGSLVVEKAFSIPGIGSLFIAAIQQNDYNVVLALSFIYTALFIGVMLLVDILYGIIDPRVRLVK